MKVGTLSTACSKPIAMYRLLGRTNPKTGKGVYQTKLPPTGIPYQVIDRTCDKCAGCRIRKRMDQSTRLTHEAQFNEHSWFITLTYDDDNLPENGSLVAAHQSAFMKALRKKLRKKMRFFSIGEYGEQTLRPHYHLILFGPDIPDRKYHHSAPIKNRATREIGKLLGPEEARYYSSELLDNVWKKGTVQLTGVSAATMQYVSKYHVEKIDGEAAKTYYVRTLPNGKCVPVEQPQARMSRNPGIGRKWIETYWSDVYPDGTMVDSKGAEFAPPKYYDDWLEKNQPEVYETLQTKRAEARTPERELNKRRQAKVANRKTKMRIAEAMKPRPKI